MSQPPNLAIIVAVIAAIPTIISPGTIGSFTALISFGCFFTWSWGELFQGVNLFRRIGGGLGLVVIVAAAVIAGRALNLF